MKPKADNFEGKLSIYLNNDGLVDITKAEMIEKEEVEEKIPKKKKNKEKNKKKD